MDKVNKYIHIDMDCFYAAVEMRDNPKYKDLPLAIGGPPDKRGVISTANYVARKFGVKSAMATAHALKLCPKLIVLPGRINYYKDVSLQIHEILSRYTELIEPISLDEAYLDVTNCPLFQGSATLIATDIRQSIFNELNLTASAGVASLMFLAKIASDVNKPNGLFVIKPEDNLNFINALDLNRIPGIGKVTNEKLNKLGLYTCQNIKQSSLSFLIQQFGKLGKMIWDKSHGIDDRIVVPDRPRKSISVERTLNQDILKWKEYLYFFEILYDELLKRLIRNQALENIAKLTVKIKFADFKQTTLEVSKSNLDKDIYLDLSKRIWSERRLNRAIRTIGLGVVLRFEKEVHSAQLSLDLN